MRLIFGTAEILACVALLALVALTGGCSTVKGFFTEPTGVITIERQDFVDSWALVTVIAEDFFKEADRACAAGNWPPVTCAKIPGTKAQAGALAVAVRAKIAVPESKLDWSAVRELLGILVSLRP